MSDEEANAGAVSIKNLMNWLKRIQGENYE